MKPILFNTEMVQAILSGRKTATRRVVKSQLPKNTVKINEVDPIGYMSFQTTDRLLDGWGNRRAPYQTDDILYVRETWCQLAHVDENGYTHYDDCQYYYATDGDYQIDLYDDNGFLLDDQCMKWRPSIHMPKEAARIFLRVTNVRVERLQEITEEQAEAEGVRARHDRSCDGTSARIAFAELWDSTMPPNKSRFNCPENGWSTNPWVWVVEFERCEKLKEAAP